MHKRDKKQQPRRHNRSKSISSSSEHDMLDPYEVHEYEKNRLHRGERFGKKWFPENKGE